MTPKQQRFVAEYLKDLDATQAAIRAGYSAKTAGQQGWQLLQIPSIAEAVKAKQAAHLAKVEITAERVLEEIARVAFVDPRAFYREDGTLKNINELDADTAAALASFDVVKQNVTAGDGKMDTVIRPRLWDKPKALALLAQRFGLVSAATVQVKVTLEDLIVASRSSDDAA